MYVDHIIYFLKDAYKAEALFCEKIIGITTSSFSNWQWQRSLTNYTNITFKAFTVSYRHNFNILGLAAFFNESTF